MPAEPAEPVMRRRICAGLEMAVGAIRQPRLVIDSAKPERASLGEGRKGRHAGRLVRRRETREGGSLGEGWSLHPALQQYLVGLHVADGECVAVKPSV